MPPPRNPLEQKTHSERYLAVQIQIEPKISMHFFYIAQDTTESEFSDMVGFLGGGHLRRKLSHHYQGSDRRKL